VDGHSISKICLGLSTRVKKWTSVERFIVRRYWRRVFSSGILVSDIGCQTNDSIA